MVFSNIPIDIFTHNIIEYFRGNYSEINEILSPISEHDYIKYKKIKEEIKITCCFDQWKSIYYNDEKKFIISINNSIITDNLDNIFSKKILSRLLVRIE